MPKYRIEGADKTTGQDISKTVSAKTSAEAQKLVAAAMFVSGITEVKDQPAKSQAAIPAYTGLTIVRFITYFYAMVLYAAGIFAIGLAVVSLINQKQANSGVTFSPDAGLFIAIGSSAILSGCIMHAVASAAEAIRDMARNSHLMLHKMSS